jgi:hypothetical protein
MLDKHVVLIILFGLLGLYFAVRLKDHPLLRLIWEIPTPFPPIKPLAQVRDDLTRDSVRDHLLFRALSSFCYGAAGMAVLNAEVGIRGPCRLAKRRLRGGLA